MSMTLRDSGSHNSSEYLAKCLLCGQSTAVLALTGGEVVFKVLIEDRAESLIVVKSRRTVHVLSIETETVESLRSRMRPEIASSLSNIHAPSKERKSGLNRPNSAYKVVAMPKASGLHHLLLITASSHEVLVRR